MRAITFTMICLAALLAEGSLRAQGLPSVVMGPQGFVIGTPDGHNYLRVRGVLQVDGRYYAGNAPGTDSFLLRRARPILEGTLFDFVDWRLMPDFGGGTALIVDAYVELRIRNWLRLRGGKFKTPFGLERLQLEQNLLFLERSLSNNLVPDRDVGAQLSGEAGGGAFAYALAILNGVPDGGQADADLDRGKDVVGRIFLSPFRPLRWRGLDRLGFGVAATYGWQHPPTGVPTFRTPGQAVFFSYLNDVTKADGVTQADGIRWRVSPQLTWYVGPVGLMADYVLSAQRVRRADHRDYLQHQAWHVALSWVITGERASYDGVAPRRPIDFRHPGFGAIEVAARYEELRVDAAAFPTYADPSKSARSARGVTAGVNWYLTGNVKFALDFSHSAYEGGAPMGSNRVSEDVLLGRLQLAL